MIQIEQTLPSSILELLCETGISSQRLYDQSFQALVTKDVTMANQVLDNKLSFEKLLKLYEETDISEISSSALLHTYLFMDRLKQIQRFVSEIAEIAIDKTESDVNKTDISIDVKE